MFVLASLSQSGDKHRDMCHSITYPPLIVLVNNIITTSVKVIIGSHIMKLKFAEGPVTNQFCIEEHLLGLRFSLS